MKRFQTTASILLSIVLFAGALATGTSAAGAQTANPRGVSCTITPNDPGVNVIISYDFNGTTEPLFRREITANGSTYSGTVFPGGSTSASVGPIGWLIRYRDGATIVDVPCTDAQPTNPAAVSCTSTSVAGGTQVEVDRGSLANNININLRRSTANGNSAWLSTVRSGDPSPTTVTGEPDDVLARYRVADGVFEVPCDAVAPSGATCEYFTIDGDTIGLVVSGVPNGLNVYVRENTPNGQRFVDILGPGGIELPSSDAYFVRYWQAGERIDTPCLSQPF